MLPLVIALWLIGATPQTVSIEPDKTPLLD